MRNVLFVFAIGALAGCSGGPKVDDTMNIGGGDQAQNYPAGPYGYVQGSIIENIKFITKEDPAGASGTADYSTLALTAKSLADYHNDSSVKYLVLSGVAGWCAPCNDEQKNTSALQAQYQPTGVRFLEAIIQGYNERTGAPATENDLNHWALIHSLHVGLALDPEDKIHQYADIAAFPLNMIVRTSDMNIVHMQVGEENIGTVLSSLP